jgi:hypothetical protein
LTLLALIGTGLLCGSALGARPRAQQQPVARPHAPSGFVEMYVAAVVPAPDGHTLLLRDGARRAFIPMAIGESEALSISMRLEGRRLDRPLTHDLLDSALRELGGRVVKVHVDESRGGVLAGRVFVEARRRLISLDARPADAIALALGSGAPIFLSRRVIARASISSADLDDELGERAPPSPEERPRAAEPGEGAI